MSGAPLQYVGVFQNHPAAQVADIATKLGLFAVQLHGEEDSAYVSELRASLPESIEIWKAYGVSDALPELLPEHIDRHLLDAKVGEQSGGTGRSFDWRLLPKHSDLMLVRTA